MGNKELAHLLAEGLKPLMRIATESYINISTLQEHYIATMATVSGKERYVILNELNNLLPDQKIKAGKFIKEIIAQYK